MKPSADPTSSTPRLALFVATGFGLGYLPLAPGTWGSLAGVALAFLGTNFWLAFASRAPSTSLVSLAAPNLLLFGATAAAGIVAAGRAARHLGRKDPQVVVIDEISGQILAFVGTLGLQPVSWKYLLLGFILFRVFDIWKPFPIRRVESWPGGWGIMGDDWLAGLYAALGLWLARAAGL